MCGIAGKIYFSKERDISSIELERMTEVITHRGPDDKGHYINANIGLGFRRLSIIDLESGHQPLSDSFKKSWITFNGEIYNYRELRTSLKSKGYTFNTGSDTEVIVNLYQEYGADCVDHLRGMFGFVIWDTEKQQLFGARDRFGIKPFHYYIDDEKFVWASEIKSILASENISKGISLKSLDYYFAYGYTPRDASIYNTIHKLKPGHCFVFKPYEKEKLAIRKYWEVSYTPDYTKTEDDWKSLIYNSLEESVKMRMVSDVPLGSFLSGGIDSSIVVSLMALNSSNPIKTFSIGFKEEKYNELKYAKLVADKYKTNHKEFIVEPESIDLLPKLVSGYDEPFADSSAIPTYYVSKYTREHVTVALSGDGGDELFIGYDSYKKFLSYANSRMPKSLFKMLNKLIPEHAYGKGMTYYKSKNREFLGAFFCFWKDYERRKIFNSDVKQQIELNHSENKKIELLKSYSGDLISKRQMLDMQTYMVDDVLTKVDRASMLNSLEVRVPILDHIFAELSFKIPSELKYKNGNKKYLLKESFKHILPQEVINHKKQGFAVPLSVWFKGELRDYAYDTLLNSNKLCSYLDKSYVNKILDYHQKGQRDFSSKIWSLLFFNEWLNQNN